MKLILYLPGLLGLVVILLGVGTARAEDTTRYFNEDGPKLSVQAGIVRDGLRLLLRVPGLKGDNMLRVMHKFIERESAWKAPEGYSMTRITLKHCGAELLHKSETAGAANESARPRKAVLLLHGGAYILKLMNLYRDMAARYSEMTGGSDVLCLDYRLAPEHVFPAALEDALDAWNWLLSKGYKARDILVVGDSAGGNLTLALTLKLRDQGRELPGALICMSPWTDMIGSGKSHTEKAGIDPIFGNNPEYMPPKGGVMPEVKPFILSYVGNADPRNPYLSPAFADYRKFPSMLIQVGTDEILESDSEQVYQRAVNAGVDATLTRYYGLFHVFQLLGNAVPESRNAWNEVKEFIVIKFMPVL